MNSIGKAYAIMSGRLTGDRQEAEQLLSSTPKKKRILQNRSEALNKQRRTTPYTIGTPPARYRKAR